MARQPSTLQVTSTLFQEGGTIPTSAAHGMAGGDNVSPDLAWSEPPEGTRSLAVTCYDPDAPTTVGFVHWVLFNLDPTLRALDAGVGAGGRTPPDAVPGFTDWGESQYGGMAPPPGDAAHHYIFTVYALDLPRIDSGPTTTYALLRFQIRDHVLAQGSLTGLFAAS